MNSTPERSKYSLLALIFTGAGAAAVVLPLPLWFGAFAGAAYLLGNGFLLGRKAFPAEPRRWQTLLGALGVWAATAVAATLVYYAYRLDAGAAFIVVAGVPALLHFFVPEADRAPELHFAGDDAGPRRPTHILSKGAAFAASALSVFTTLALAAYAWGLLAGAATDVSMRSPWDVVPRAFFIVVVLVAAIAFASAYGRLTTAGLVGLGALVVLTAAVSALVYRIGFGFDPFIHRATEAVIYARGVVDPKPFYYIGQYATVTLAARMLGGHVAAVDVWLMTVALALLVPFAYWGMRRGFGWRPGTAAAAACGLLALPLSPFAATTPQGLADALLLITAFVALAFAEGAAPWWYVALLAVATAAVHPLAGVPLLMFVAILLYVRASERLAAEHGTARWLLLAKLVIIASIALPAMFVLNSFLSGSAGVQVDTASLTAPSSLLSLLAGPSIATRKFIPALDLVYSWRAVRSFSIVIGGIVGLWLMRERARRAATAIGAGAIAFFANYVLLKTVVHFPFLIAYERGNYADRMIDLTLFLLAPAALYAFGRLLARVRRSGFPALAVGMTALVAMVAVSSVYLAYPRRDPYETTRGWSTGADDIAAVDKIAADAGGRAYVVLSDQAVSAAAIDRHGFLKYYPSNDPSAPAPVFYYPVPTGGPLYAVFLDMNNDLGAAKDARRAMDLAGVNTVYFVVDHYWWNAQQITAEARREADSWWSVNGKVWVFKYTR